MSHRFEDLMKIDQGSGLNSFYMSFGDLMVILCCFFVLMHSISKVDVGSFERIRAEFTGVEEGSLVELAQMLQEMTKEIKEVQVSYDPDGVRLNLETATLFRVNSAVLRKGALSPIKRILFPILKTDYAIDVEGHTDDRRLYRYKEEFLETNWSLSGLRASTVVHYLLELGVAQERLRLVGYAATRPKIKVSGKSGKELEKARDANRRVSILVH